MLNTTPSASGSSLGPTSPSVTVTLDQLVLAIDKMGFKQSVSAAELYHTILQLQSTPYKSPPNASARRKAILQIAMEKPKKNPGFPPVSREIVMVKPDSDFFKPERREKRRKILEMTKESYRDRIPSIYTSVTRSSNERPLSYSSIEVTSEDKSDSGF